jgi:hypothetical protein
LIGKKWIEYLHDTEINKIIFKIKAIVIIEIILSREVDL